MMAKDLMTISGLVTIFLHAKKHYTSINFQYEARKGTVHKNN